MSSFFTFFFPPIVLYRIGNHSVHSLYTYIAIFSFRGHNSQLNQVNNLHLGFKPAPSLLAR